jgi:hypothetical protein
MTPLRAPPLTLLDKSYGRDFPEPYSTTVTVSGGNAVHHALRAAPGFPFA